MSATVTSCNEQAIGQNADDSLDTGPVRVRQFCVTISAADAFGADIAKTGTGIPALGAAWGYAITGMPTPKCRSISARLLSDAVPTKYTVSCEYRCSRKVIEQLASDEVAPWDRAPKYAYDFIEYPRALVKDLASSPLNIVNSAGDSFDPPPETRVGNLKVTITRASTKVSGRYSPGTATTLVFTTNSGSITFDGRTVAAGIAKLLRWSGTENTWTATDGTETAYFDEIIELELSTDATNKHKLVLVNQGFNYYKTASTPSTKAKIVLGDGSTPASPQHLATDGTVSTAGPNELTFTQYASASWTAIGIA